MNKLCEYENCRERVAFGPVIDKEVEATRCKEHKTTEMRRYKFKGCSVIDCNKCARGGFDKCVSHGGCVLCDDPDCKSAADKTSGKCKLPGGFYRCAEPGYNNDIKVASVLLRSIDLHPIFNRYNHLY